MTTKRYKTVSGYLSSRGRGLQYSLSNLSDDQVIAATKTGQRDIINNLLPQLGLPVLLGGLGEELHDGINRLIEAGGTEHQIKALKDCARWLRNYKIVTIVGSAVIPQVKTEQGFVSYHVYGFSRTNHSVKISLIVDAEEYGGKALEIAQAIAGPDYCLHASSNISHLVPDAAKNRIFTSDEELYAADPEMRPRVGTRRSRRAAR